MPSHLTRHCKPEAIALHDRLATEGPLPVASLTNDELVLAGGLIFQCLAHVVLGNQLALTYPAAEAYRIAEAHRIAQRQKRAR